MAAQNITQIPAVVLEQMGLKGDKSGEMSVSNALTALTKSNQVHREGGKYRAM
jgi:hypothetical protein